MNIKKENNQMVIRVPLTQKSYDAADQLVGEVDNLVGFSNGKEYSICYLNDLGYKGDIQLGGELIELGSLEELNSICTDLGIDIWHYDRCSKCDDTLYGSMTFDEDGKFKCTSC